jgi:glutamyl-tRNA reductase
VSANLLVAGISHRSAPLALRERLALPSERAADLMSALRSHDGIGECVVVSTCNRSELYLVAGEPDRALAVAAEELGRACGIAGSELAGAIRSSRDMDAARHLFRVTAGLESMVVGEAEVQGQVRRAYELALERGASGRITNRLFQDALRAGKRVRSETGISRSPASVASVAVDLGRRALGGLAGRHVLVIGAGKHGELTALTLAEQGADTVFVASRAHERAQGLAQRFGGAAVSFEKLAEELARADLVLTCTACPERIVSRADLASAGRRLVVIDTAVPRDVDPAARDLPAVELYDLDDIERELARSVARRGEAALRAEPILQEELVSFERWLATLEVVPTISALRDRGRAAVDRALRRNEPHWQALTDDDRRRVELLAHAAVSDLLREPTLNLRRAGEQGASSLYVEALQELFALEAAGSGIGPAHEPA